MNMFSQKQKHIWLHRKKISNRNEDTKGYIRIHRMVGCGMTLVAIDF